MPNLPWQTILLHGPTIVEAARKLYTAARKGAAETESTARTGDGIEPLRRAVEILEEREVQQAAVLADLAKQVQEMGAAVDVLRRRVMLSLVGTAVAILLASVAVALALR